MRTTVGGVYIRDAEARLLERRGQGAERVLIEWLSMGVVDGLSRELNAA